MRENAGQYIPGLSIVPVVFAQSSLGQVVNSDTNVPIEPETVLTNVTWLGGCLLSATTRTWHMETVDIQDKYNVTRYAKGVIGTDSAKTTVLREEDGDGVGYDMDPTGQPNVN